MTIGVGGSTPEQELSKLDDKTLDVQPISKDELASRVHKARLLFKSTTWPLSI